MFATFIMTFAEVLHGQQTQVVKTHKNKQKAGFH